MESAITTDHCPGDTILPMLNLLIVVAGTTTVTAGLFFIINNSYFCEDHCCSVNVTFLLRVSLLSLCLSAVVHDLLNSSSNSRNVLLNSSLNVLLNMIY